MKSAETGTVTIPRNGRTTVSAFIDKRIHCGSTLVMTHPTKKTTLPDGVEVTPTVARCHDDQKLVFVEVNNLSSTPVVIQPRGLLCELQQVEVATDAGELNTDSREKAEDSQEQEGTSDKEKFQQQFDFPNTDLTADQIQKVKDLLWSYQDIFSKDEFDIGHAQTVKHRIELTDTTPFKQRHRRVPPAMYQEVKNHLRHLKEGGIIRESSSPYASAVVLVRKRNGALRMCVDFRQLNQRTVKDNYALPRIEEMIDHMAGSKYFSSLDLRSGYYQVEMEEEHKPRTAFTVGPWGFWEFERMPFGLTNAPATFQRLMEKAMGELHMTQCFTFLDDVIVPGTDFEEAYTRLGNTLQKTRENNLKLNAKKCQFFKTRVKYCGHIVSKDGVGTDPDKTAQISEWKTPENQTEVRQFLGFSGYYRRLVEGYSKIAKPLTDLLGGGKRKKKGKKTNSIQPPPKWKWGPEQEKAFQELKDRLTSPLY